MSKICTVALVVVILFGGLAVAQKPVAERPRVYIDTTWSLPVGGTTWAAHTSAQLSSALTYSSPGDIIVLDAGATYIGNFTLPGKPNPSNKWIYIVSSQLANLPVGVRVSPASAANMPKLVTTNVGSVFQLGVSANHWRIVGVEMTSASTYPSGCGVAGHPNCMTYFLWGNSWPPPTPTGTFTLPDSFILDRCYIHGSDTLDMQAAVQIMATNFAVIDSDVRDVHIAGFDSNAVGSNVSPGPIKIVNNYLSAAGENIIFGGGGKGWGGYVPSDIEIRNNWIFKPLEWVPLSLPPLNKMVVKNLLEFKSAQRVLVDGNTFENVWAAGQAGYAIVLTVRTSQSGDVAVVNDITITNNVLKNVASGFNTLGADDVCGSAGYTDCLNAGSQDRWYIANNLVTFYDPTLPGGTGNVGIAFKQGLNRPLGTTPTTLGFMQDVVFQHNTLVPAASKPCSWGVYFGDASGYTDAPYLTNNIWILDNVLCRQTSGDNGKQGKKGLKYYMGDPSADPNGFKARYYGNVMYVPPGDSVQSFPPHNYSTTVPFTYVDPASDNYQLLTPYWTDTSDGNITGISSISLPAPY